MIRALVLICALLATPALAGSSVHRTPDGHEYHHIEIAGAQRVGLALRWAGTLDGLTREDASVPLLAGVAVTRGPAGGRQAADIVEDLADLDTAVSVNVSLGGASLFVAAPQEALGEAADIVADLAARPALEPRWVARERDRLADAQINLRDRTSVAARRMIGALTIRDPAAEAFVASEPEAIRAVTDDQVAAWHRRMLAGGIVAIATAGPVDHARMGAVIDRIVAALPKGTVEPAPPAPVEVDMSARAAVLRIANPNGTYVAFAGPVPGGPVVSQAAEIAVDLLGDGTGSRLFRDVRLGARASYNMRTSGFDLVPGRKVFAIEGDLATASFARGLDAVRESYERWRRGDFTAAEIDRARRVHVDHVDLPWRNPSVAAVTLAARMARERPDGPFATGELRPDLSAVPDEAVREAARRFPPFDELVRIVLTRDVETALEKFPGACVVERLARARRCLSR